MTIPVNEVFETVQGEGFHAGRPSVFIRLQGCPVGCPWCDTKFTWDQLADREISAGEVVTKDQSGEDTWGAFDTPMLMRLMERFRANHVVITGGEPAMHDLFELTATLATADRSSQIETSGTFPIKVVTETWVTVSPKLNMPGGLPVLDEALARANEIKMPIGKNTDIAVLHELLDRGVHRPDVAICLQPLSLSRAATDICKLNAIANNWRVSIQTHRLAGWR
jgi:7-carboxy-7-deazaguanine synthase